MPDANELVLLMKKAALDAVEASKPVQWCYGTVKKTDPVEVLVDQRFTLGKQQLVELESENESAAGDEVVLLRQQGGQKYLILGKVKK